MMSCCMRLTISFFLLCFRYENPQALKAHGTSDKFKAFQKKLGEADLVRAPMVLKMVAKQAGFSSRL